MSDRLKSILRIVLGILVFVPTIFLCSTCSLYSIESPWLAYLASGILFYLAIFTCGPIGGCVVGITVGLFVDNLLLLSGQYEPWRHWSSWTLEYSPVLEFVPLVTRGLQGLATALVARHLISRQWGRISAVKDRFEKGAIMLPRLTLAWGLGVVIGILAHFILTTGVHMYVFYSLKPASTLRYYLVSGIKQAVPFLFLGLGWLLWGILTVAGALPALVIASLVPSLVRYGVLSLWQQEPSETAQEGKEPEQARQTEPQPSIAPGQPSKTCPSCAEVIRAGARVCRYCGHEFTEADVSVAIRLAEQASRRDKLRAKRYRLLWLGWPLTVIGGLLSLGGGFLLLLLTVAQFSGPKGAYDDLTTFITILVLCPLPVLVLGLAVLGVGLFSLRRARRMRLTESDSSSVVQSTDAAV
jgi:hypothetical protein